MDGMIGLIVTAFVAGYVRNLKARVIAFCLSAMYPTLSWFVDGLEAALIYLVVGVIVAVFGLLIRKRRPGPDELDELFQFKFVYDPGKRKQTKAEMSNPQKALETTDDDTR